MGGPDSFLGKVLPRVNSVMIEIIDKLNELTKQKNREWCEERIIMAIGEYKANIGGTILSKYDGPSIKTIIFGDCDEDEEWKPNLNIYPKIEGRYEDSIKLDLIYYNCGKCGKLDDYGQYEDSDNCLLCMDCQNGD